jgi:8-oxo-dGTP diphosphatase
MTEVVAALIWEGRKFMICQRPAHKARGLLWEFVGGKVEPGEPQLLEHNDLRWITPGEIDRYDFCPADEALLKEIKESPRGH